jgi:phosphoglycerate dehydrogenase-like enzyme
MLKDSMSGLTLLVLFDPRARHHRVLERLPDSTNIVVTDDPAHIAQSAPRADVILTGPQRHELIRHAFPHAVRLRWVHSLSAGVEGVLVPELVSSPVPLTNGRGVFARPLAEWCIGAALFFSYDLRRMVHSQEEGRWDQFDTEHLSGKTLAIVGYGEIGRAVAERVKPFGVRVLALKRRPDRTAMDRLVERVFTPEEKSEMLSQADYIVCAAPLTPETRGMIGEKEFAAMRPNAVIMNVGRGAVIDEAALIKALESRRIRGAALDVFDEEPLPSGHAFYRLRNVLLSPHTADHTPGWVESAVEFFVGNFERFTSNQPLLNLVDKHAGY